jgi:hypothetical protein
LLAHLLIVLLASLLTRLLAGGDNLFVGSKVALLGWTETALGQFAGGKLAHAVIRADLTEEAIIRDVPFRDVVTAVAQLTYDLCLCFSQHIRVFLKNLDNLVSREFGVLGKRFSRKGDTKYNQREQKPEPRAAMK